MVFEPSKTTKSLGLNNPKVLDTKVQVDAAIAVPIAPLKNLEENFDGVIVWNKIKWTKAEPIIKCLSKFYTMEEKKVTQKIFKGLDESCTDGFLSFQKVVEVTACETIYAFYIKYLKESMVYPKLFELIYFRSHIGGILVCSNATNLFSMGRVLYLHYMRLMMMSLTCHI